MTVVLIVDDHHLIRTGVKNLLESEFPDTRVEGADSVATALTFLADYGDVDLVLLDIQLPDASTLDGLTRLKQSFPATPVAMISGTDDNEIIRAALAIGADGFIPKSANPQILTHAVSLMLKGEMFLPRTFLQSPDPEGEVRADGNGKNVVLTDRQCEVFALMRDGLSNKEIARQLLLSESTVKTHISAILKGFGTTSRTKAIARSIELGWSQ